jgi:hypothetical protein
MIVGKDYTFGCTVVIVKMVVEFRLFPYAISQRKACPIDWRPVMAWS